MKTIEDLEKLIQELNKIQQSQFKQFENAINNHDTEFISKCNQIIFATSEAYNILEKAKNGTYFG